MVQHAFGHKVIFIAREVIIVVTGRPWNSGPNVPDHVASSSEDYHDFGAGGNDEPPIGRLRLVQPHPISYSVFQIRVIQCARLRPQMLPFARGAPHYAK